MYGGTECTPSEFTDDTKLNLFDIPYRCAIYMVHHIYTIDTFIPYT